MKATVAERGQVTIPKPLAGKTRHPARDETGLQGRPGKLVAVKVSDEDPVGRVFGCLGRGLKTDAMIRSLRGRA